MGNSTKDSDLQLTSFCPSCMKKYEHWQGFETLLCSDCVQLRDDRIEHSEEDIQDVVKKNTK